MADRYFTAINSGVGKALAPKLGLPRPVPLRRFVPGEGLVPGPLLLLDAGGADDDAAGGANDAEAGSTGDSTAVRQALEAWGVDVRDSRGGQSDADDAVSATPDRWAAIVLVATELDSPAGLAPAALTLGANLRRLAAGGRVVVLGRAPEGGDPPRRAAARQGLDGFTRSLAKELRDGATANAIFLTDAAAPTSESVLAALGFFLSGKSAFVDGQVLRVGAGVARDGVSASSDVRGLPSAPPASELPLSGKVAVVTGGARGIGAAIARVLARDGASVVVVDVPAAGEALTAVANDVGGTALQLDITAPDAAQRIADHVRTRHGQLHVLVHNAGILRDKLLANMSADRWESVIDVNLLAQLRINDYLLGERLFGAEPRIVSLASTSGIAGNRGQTNYGFSKAGVIGAVQATAPLLAALGGTANAVAPGFIETEMTASMPLVAREMARRASSLAQGGQPADVAEAVAFLASPAAGGINGQVLRVCGQNLVGR